MSRLGGLAEVAINGKILPAELLSEVSVELTEATRERKTLAGTFTSPSGTLDTAMATFTIYLPSIDYLKNIFPSRYNAPTAPETSGNIIWNTQDCSEVETGPVNIHFTCEPTDKNDVYFYQGAAQLNFNPTYTAEDDISIEVTVHAQPDVNGNVYRLGTGSLTALSHFDAVTGVTVSP